MVKDVTKTITEGIEVWPGDVEYHRTQIDTGCFTSSSVVMSLHTGTHMDAPRHMYENGRTIDSFMPVVAPALVKMQGNCRGKAVVLDRPLTAEEALCFAEMGAVLVGTSSISIDHNGVTDAHRILLGAGIPVMENLDLTDIEPGEYIILAFPLKFGGADGSPVRVLLAESLEELIQEDQ
jgi:arylformamidase